MRSTIQRAKHHVESLDTYLLFARGIHRPSRLHRQAALAVAGALRPEDESRLVAVLEREQQNPNPRSS